ncbi:MAG: hypothetical protein ACI80R_000694 [Aquiluna sp.]|jgi:hypothetical protein
MLDAFSSSFLVLAYLAAALFHFAIALGAPLAEYVQGESPNGELRFSRRALSLGLFFVFMAIVGHYLAQLGLFMPILDVAGNAVVNWVLVAIATAQALIANTAKNLKQKKLWSGPTVAMLLAAVIVAF